MSERHSGLLEPEPSSASSSNPEDGMVEGGVPTGVRQVPYLPTLDVLRTGLDVHGHGHDHLQPGLDGAGLPVRHGRGPDQLHLLQPVCLLLALRQAEALSRGAALAVRVCNTQAHRAVLGSGVRGRARAAGGRDWAGCAP